MSRILNGYIRAVTRLNDAVGNAVAWLTTILVLVVCYDVFTRYVLRQSSVAVQELEWHLFAVIFLVGAAYTLIHDRHVRVDVFYQRFSPRTKALINLLGSLLFLLPFTLLGIWSSSAFVLSSFRIREISPDPGGLPGRYLLKAVIPLGFVLLLLQGLALLFRSVLEIKGNSSEAENNG